jgi:hypothetical protein
MLGRIRHTCPRSVHARYNTSHIPVLEQPMLDIIRISKLIPLPFGLFPWRHNPMSLIIRTRANKMATNLTSEGWNTMSLPSYYAFLRLDSYAESVITASQLCCERLMCSGTWRRVVKVITSDVSKDRNVFTLKDKNFGSLVSEQGHILVLPVVVRSCSRTSSSYFETCIFRPKHFATSLAIWHNNWTAPYL